MTCLPNTGVDAPVLVVLAAGAAFALVGLAMMWRARRSGAGPALLLLVVIAVGGGIAVGLAPAPPAFADCVDGHDQDHDSHPDSSSTTEPEATVTIVEPEVDNSLTITQTSTMDDLAPGAAPEAIAGIVVNNGPDDTFVTAIVVSIEAVERSDDAVPGSCDASDYVLLDVRMPVGETLGPFGGTAAFEGAAIGLTNKSTNQDACQGATVKLRYTTASS